MKLSSPIVMQCRDMIRFFFSAIRTADNQITEPAMSPAALSSAHRDHRDVGNVRLSRSDVEHEGVVIYVNADDVVILRATDSDEVYPFVPSKLEGSDGKSARELGLDRGARVRFSAINDVVSNFKILTHAEPNPQVVGAAK